MTRVSSHDDRRAPQIAGRRCSRRMALRAAAAGVTAASLLAGGSAARAQSATPVAPAANPDFKGLVSIGDRSLYTESSGQGGPTVVLISGYRASGRYWTDDLLHPEAPREMVLPGVAGFTHVWTYDRPGTYAELGDEILPSRSDAIAQPRNSTEVATELHELLHAAAVPGPYVLAGHSLGGFFARLYASTYPAEVIGLVLIDAYSEGLETVMSAEQFAALKQLNQAGGTDTVLPIPGYGDDETLPWGADNEVMRKAAAAQPLPPLPLAVLSHGIPFPLPANTAGFAPDELERYLQAANEAQAALVPDSRYFMAATSGHDIHQDQPGLVIEAIRQVVTGVREPDTWSDLRACCQD